MKKLLVLLSFVFIHASNIEYYLYSINFDYKEYSSSGVYLDGESSNFGSLNGIGVKYSDRTSLPFYLKGEYAYGSTHYDGSTWGGTPLSLTKDGVYLINLEGGIHPFRNPYYLAFGYRYWNRGKSDYPGDYDEQYYWSYFSFGYFYIFKIRKVFLTTDFQYQLAINPKLDAHIGSGTTLDLGTTEGLKFQIASYFKYNSRIMISLMYRYQFWHINRSDPASVVLNGTTTYIVEPESFTRNQYLGIGVLYKF
ncbi:hypothetical protein NAMH_1021 [Nautilia profundicola AmH]|uniref:Outer membrane protein beta-barrel domain-containing protein n=1 Tax=Nautilia profundicola (strain ATCC BAA-1463 / DSM 18972 / AmH) TaxID=598659 RepID=B9L9W3_NAUPA|nr:hypothetical protein [Nautilia profundicola]ACM92153.1 hypothetical protein NAMH_1021 [Nautilia profundicola AmH]